MAIYIGTNQVKNIYVGTQEVKRVYVGTQLVFPTILTDPVVIKTYSQGFANDNYYVDHTVTVTERNVAANTMKVQVETKLRSVGNYTISASAPKDGKVTLDGQNKTFTFNASLTAGQTKTVDTTTFTISNASGRTVTLSSEMGVDVNIIGFGQVQTVYSNHGVTLPTM